MERNKRERSERDGGRGSVAEGLVQRGGQGQEGVEGVVG